ncbi:hypothetical protein [Winogradskyella sp.]|uniref:hypothetical protein n=1 Tax=Winogradskyella sp. TaxID=1883156 RepID=UPI003AB77906
MVYLIDDKKYRQENDFHWTTQRFDKYSDIIKPIYHLEEFTLLKDQIFKNGNIVLYHESFLDSTTSRVTSQQKRIELEEFAANKDNFKLAIFSGSMFARSLADNLAYLSVSVLYNNLTVFLNKIIQGEGNLNYLLFGDMPLIEKKLNDKLNEALSITNKENSAKIEAKANLILRPVRGFISSAIENADKKVLYNKDLSDRKMSQYIEDWLDNDKYDNIFIPLCFGTTLSDYNGLRLATHIRCTDSVNQLSRIFIYGFADLEYLFDNECFNILKTKNVELIPFSKAALEKAGNKPEIEFTSEQLFEQLKKIKLNVPRDYDDNHSISNEWAIKQWTYCLPKPFYVQIDKVLDKVENGLYFKYLSALRPAQNFETIKEQELKISNSNGEKVLLIDNDYKKGWQVLFNYILAEANNLRMDTLEIDFRSFSREQIINKAFNKIIDPNFQRINYDIIILDFRLHPSDNKELNIDLITGMQILKKIKEFNPGIQVVVFSATNKVWNLQALQTAGADGFIFKEGALESVYLESIKPNILNLLDLMKKSLNRSFLKTVWINKSKIIKHLKSNPLKKFFPTNLELLKALGYQNLILDELNISYSILDSNESNKYPLVMLSLYKILECLTEIFITSERSDGKLLFWDKTEVKFCQFSNGKYDLITKSNQVNINAYKSTSNKVQCLMWQKLGLSENKLLKFIFELSRYRNNYIHPKNRFELGDLNQKDIVRWVNQIENILIKI